MEKSGLENEGRALDQQHALVPDWLYSHLLHRRYGSGFALVLRTKIQSGARHIKCGCSVLWRLEDRAQARTGTSRGLPYLNCKENTCPTPSQGAVRIECDKGSEILTICGHSNRYLYEGHYHSSHPAELRGYDRLHLCSSPTAWGSFCKALKRCPAKPPKKLHLLGTHFRFCNLKHLGLSKTDNISQEVKCVQ